MLTPESRDLLQSVYDDLAQYNPYPETASIDDQDAWMRREGGESALAGLIATALAPGRVDRQTLNETRLFSREKALAPTQPRWPRCFTFWLS
jgi:hypothetical protein